MPDIFVKRNPIVLILLLTIAALACGKSVSPFPDPTYTPRAPVFESGRTAYGFFPVPPEVTLNSVFETYKAIGQHADVVLFQENIPWADFLDSSDGNSQKIIDLKNTRSLAQANNLDGIYVIDPLNGLNRREFSGLPREWGDANFSTPNVRRAYLNFTLRILREFKPHYLGLASEINTYADAHPADFPNFLSLYRETYAAIKAEAPLTQVFVTFQWEGLNNLGGFKQEGQPYHTKWEQIEVFEPQLDVWVISSYPFIAFPSGSAIPADYYIPLLTRTAKPLAVAEGGYNSRPVGNAPGKAQDQIDYLKAIHTQLGSRLDFWIYLILSDFNLDSYARSIPGRSADAQTLGMFTSIGLREKDGTPKPALHVWDNLRGQTP
jgi:hypothetical protein